MPEKTIEVSLTQFINFATSQDVKRVSTVETIQMQGGQSYDPKKDFYKRFREQIVDVESGKIDISSISDLPSNLNDKKKINNYKNLSEGYLDWKQKFNFKATKTKNGIWKEGKLSIKVNPEIAIIDDTIPTYIKLYFKKEPIPKNKIKILLHIMHTALVPNFNGQVGILEVRSGKLHTLNEIDPRMTIYLKSEVSAFLTTWELVKPLN